MSDDKLGGWLNKFTGKDGSAPSQKPPTPTPGKSQAPKKTSTFQKPISTIKKATSAAKNTAQKGAQKISHGAHKAAGKAKSKSPFTNHDPHKDRKTHEKRDRFHPTNRLKAKPSGDIRVVPLGGMEEVGENMMFIEWGDDIIVIDTGFVFSGLDHYGVEAQVADVSYLEKNKHKIKGVIYTHGHLDHIGGAPYVLPRLGFPKVYATRLTSDMMLAQCDEHPGVKDKVKVFEITPKSKLKMGRFEVEFFHINHSIPDGVGIAVKTPYGFIVNTSDFKIDHNPADEQPADLERIAHIGHQGVALAMVDSTNALRGGHAISESIIKDTLHDLLEDSDGRVIVATFSSNVGRVAKLVESAESLGRTVFLTGRSMERNITIARKNNFLKCKDRTLQRMSKKVESMDPKKVLILCTGSQGEELAALTRMARGEHKDVKLKKSDTLVFSSSPIPGNEKQVGSVLDNLARLGVDHIDNKQMEVHVSGHGHAEELKLMTALLNPKYFAPIHGEVHMRYAHAKLANNDLGIKKENCFIMENGRGVVLNAKGCRLMTAKENVSNGKVNYIQDRKIISADILQQRKTLAAGALIVRLKHAKGSLKKVEYKNLGFQITDPNHDFFKQLENNIKQTWLKQYDPSRPEKVLEKPMKAMIEKFILQYLKPRKDSFVEVII